MFLFIIFAILGGFTFYLFNNLYGFNKKEIAPFDRIKEKDILVYSDKVIINISNVQLVNYTDTGSMKSTLDEFSNGLKIPVKNESDIHIGDIITYKIEECKKPEDIGFKVELKNNTNITKVEVCKFELIVHRVIKIEEDEQGWYAITKGDNNKFDDVVLSFGKVRFSQVKGVIIGLIY